jgi:hypothetical protein
MSDARAPDPVAAGAVDGARPDLEAGRQGIGQGNTQKESGAQAPLPYFVQIGDDPRGGMVAPDLLGGYRAVNWQGTIGTFPTAVEAERALIKAPRAPRQPRPEPNNSKPKPIPSHALTGAGSTYAIREKGRTVGAVTLGQDGRYVAWARLRKIGAFDAFGPAYSAASAALAAKSVAHAPAFDGEPE